jgi:hypothetical protein
MATRRPRKEDLLAAEGRTLPDVIAPDNTYYLNLIAIKIMCLRHYP